MHQAAKRPEENQRYETLPMLAAAAGIACLVEGMCHFADEFGISRERIFGELYKDLQGQVIEDVLLHWLREGTSGARRIEHLFEILAAHQMALTGGLEGVASEAMAHFNPQQFKNRSLFVPGVQPGAWRSYCSYYDELASNQHQLHQKLILPGFLSAYLETRNDPPVKNSSG